MNLIAELKKGNPRALAKTITLCESKLDSKRQLGLEVLDSVHEPRLESTRIAISGPPGVGKSSLIEKLGLQILQDPNTSIAILPVDPSSPVAGGSILGDRTRMEKLSSHPRVFIRPTPAGDHLGGVHTKTPEVIRLCEAAGYKLIIIETVGVGQSEIEAKSMCDVYISLHQPHSGDELQGIKKGINEVSDIIAITKADGPTKSAAELCLRQLQSAFDMKHSSSTTKSLIVSAVTGHNIDKLKDMIYEAVHSKQKNGEFQQNRSQQILLWFQKELTNTLLDKITESAKTSTHYSKLEKAVLAGSLSPSRAASDLVKIIWP